MTVCTYFENHGTALSPILMDTTGRCTECHHTFSGGDYLDDLAFPPSLPCLHGRFHLVPIKGSKHMCASCFPGHTRVFCSVPVSDVKLHISD